MHPGKLPARTETDMPTSADPCPPKLPKHILNDDNALSDAISSVVATSSQIRHLQRRIRQRQNELCHAADRRAWRIYLKLEALHVRRLDEETLLVARWAYRQGRRAGRKRARPRGERRRGRR